MFIDPGHLKDDEATRERERERDIEKREREMPNA
jgi:hypothetical protein